METFYLVSLLVFVGLIKSSRVSSLTVSTVMSLVLIAAGIPLLLLVEITYGSIPLFSAA